MTMTEEKTDMDAFKELMARSPDMEVMTLDELHGMVFWSGAAVKWAKTNIEIAKDLGGLTSQIDAWAEEGNAAAEFNFKARAKRGELAKKEESVKPKKLAGTGVGRGNAVSSGEPPKWQRLGYKSEWEMKDDEFLDNNPKIVEEVKEQAKKAGDFPSVTAAKNAYRAKRAEDAYHAERAKNKGRPAPALGEHLEWCITQQHEINIKLSRIMENPDQVEADRMKKFADLVRRAAAMLMNANTAEESKWHKLISE